MSLFKKIKRVCCIGCPGGFKYIASVSGCYKVVKKLQTWDKAAQHCQSLHSAAHLIVIDSAVKQRAIRPLLDS